MYELPEDDIPQVDYRVRRSGPDSGDLYRLCDTVPYLLGPKSYLDAIARTSNTRCPVETFQYATRKSGLDSGALTSLDKRFMMFLKLLQAPAERRSKSENLALRAFTFEEKQMLVYKDSGWDNQITPFGLTFDAFMGMMNRWNILPNPYLVMGDKAGATTKWSDVAGLLMDRKVSLHDIDCGIYDELTSLPYEQLQGRIDNLIESGELQSRKRARDLRTNAAIVSNVVHYSASPSKNKATMYNRRFSHKHPLGENVDFTKPRQDGLHHNEDKAVKKTEQEQKMERRQMETKRRRRSARRIMKYIVWILIILGLAGGIGFAAHLAITGKSAGRALSS
jgi:hypothetical protein